MAEPTALRLHDNQSFPDDQLGYAPKCAFLERYGVKYLKWNKWVMMTNNNILKSSGKYGCGYSEAVMEVVNIILEVHKFASFKASKKVNN
eukprot:scaffold30874_cov59-Attheya_sp.AAC.1